jgi:hypothetical protein
LHLRTPVLAVTGRVRVRAAAPVLARLPVFRRSPPRFAPQHRTRTSLPVAGGRNERSSLSLPVTPIIARPVEIRMTGDEIRLTLVLLAHTSRDRRSGHRRRRRCLGRGTKGSVIDRSCWRTTYVVRTSCVSGQLDIGASHRAKTTHLRTPSSQLLPFQNPQRPRSPTYLAVSTDSYPT